MRKVTVRESRARVRVRVRVGQRWETSNSGAEIPKIEQDGRVTSVDGSKTKMPVKRFFLKIELGLGNLALGNFRGGIG